MYKALAAVAAFAAVGFLFGVTTGRGSFVAWSVVIALGAAGLDGILTALNEKAHTGLRVFGGVGFLVCAYLAFLALDYARLLSQLDSL